ncbi:MAG: glycosyltransferase [Betaproteobacteria bacterium]
MVTASYVVPWHLDNTLRRITSDFDVTVVGQGVSSNEAAYPGIEWVDIDLNRKISVFADLRALWQLCRLFRARKPDIVHSIMPKAGLISALAGFICRVPIRVHTFTGQIWTNRRPVARLVLYLLDRTINALNTVCLTDSPSQSQLLYRHGFSSHGLPLPVLGQGSLSGVDFSRFDQSGQDARRKQLRTDLGIGEQDFVFAFVARKSREKGAIDMIRAFSQVTAAHEVARLLFVGPDESSGELAAMRKDTPALFKNVDDIGQVPDHERYLAISQVLCLPSYREGFGSIVIDAAATGVPVIGSDIAGLVDSIENGKTGLLIPPGNIGKLVQAMLSMLENPQDCRQMGFAARHRAEDLFAADKMYALLRDFYFVKLSEKP